MDLLHFLENSKLFFQEIKDCQYTLEQTSIKFSKGERNLQKIMTTVSNIDFQDNDDIQFQNRTPSEIIKYTKEINNYIYQNRYEEFIDELLSFIKKDHTISRFDAAIASEYDIVDKTKTFIKGYIYSLTQTYCPILLNHEATHMIYEHKIPSNFNYNYNEFCSIFVDLVAANYMDSIIGDQHLSKYKTIRFNHFKQNCFEYDNLQKRSIDLQQAPDKLNQQELILQYSYYGTYQYIISTIYAFSLFQLYLNDKQVLEQFRKVVSHQMTIPEILEYYNISLRNHEIVQSFQKELITKSI